MGRRRPAARMHRAFVRGVGAALDALGVVPRAGEEIARAAREHGDPALESGEDFVVEALLDRYDGAARGGSTVYGDVATALRLAGLRDDRARRLAAPVQPLAGGSYSTYDLLDIALRLALRPYRPVGPPGQPFLIPLAARDAWAHVAPGGTTVPAGAPRAQHYNCDAQDGELQAAVEAAAAALPPQEGDDDDDAATLFHATSWRGAQSVLAHGVLHATGRKCLDFGVTPSFYLTPDARVAAEWAQKSAPRWGAARGPGRSLGASRGERAVLVFRVPRGALARGLARAVAFGEPRVLPPGDAVVVLGDDAWATLVAGSRRCDDEANALDVDPADGAHVDAVEGPMLRNAEAVRIGAEAPRAHRPPRHQVALKSDAADRLFGAALAGVVWARAF